MATVITWDKFKDLPQSEKVYLVEMDAIKASDLSTTTFYFGTTGKAFANYYIPNTKGVPRLVRSQQEVFEGTSVKSWGDIIILRKDGEEATPAGVFIDDITDGTWIVRNQDITIKFGGEQLPYSEYQTIFTGKARKITGWNNQQITIQVIDNQEILSEKIVTPNVVTAATYANAPASVIGQTIPVALGECDNVKPILVDTVSDIYLVHDTDTVGYESITTVYDKGKSVAFTDNGDGTFTLTATATGTVTCDIQGAKFGTVPAYKTKIADIAQGLLEEFGGFATASIDAAFISQCNTDIPYTVGLFISKKQNISDTLDQLMDGIPMWYTFERSGIFRIGEFKLQSGTPDHTITQEEIDRGSMTGATHGDVIWRQIIRYGRNYTPISESEADATLTLSQKAALAKEWNETEYSDATILTVFELATEADPRNTAIKIQADAVDVAEKWIDLLGAFRVTYDFVIKTLSLDYELSDVVSLTYQFPDEKGNTFYRFNLNDTRFRLTDIEEDYINNSVKLKVFG